MCEHGVVKVAKLIPFRWSQGKFTPAARPMRCTKESSSWRQRRVEVPVDGASGPAGFPGPRRTRRHAVQEPEPNRRTQDGRAWLGVIPAQRCRAMRLSKEVMPSLRRRRPRSAIFHSETPGGRAVQEKSKRMNSEGIQSINATSCGHISG